MNPTSKNSKIMGGTTHEEESRHEIHHHHHYQEIHHHHHYHDTATPPPNHVMQPGKPCVRISPKTDLGYLISIKEGVVVLAPSNPVDDNQWWYKDEKNYSLAKDEQGQPGFALVNRATNQALKHSFGHSHPVQLITYDPHAVDESILWTQCKEDLGDGYQSIRMINNTNLTVDAYAANVNGAADGTPIVLWHWHRSSNQQWLMTPRN